MNRDIAIIGNGWVGKSMQKLFPSAWVYVRDASKYPLGSLMVDDKSLVNKCNIAFICVPSPVIGEGKLDTSIIEEIIAWCTCPLIVVRSTVNPGDCDRWMDEYHKNIIFQPEYLGETPDHPLINEKKTPFIIIGSRKRGLGYREEDARVLIDLYATVYNADTKIRQVSLLEAEIIKLSENRAIAFKVAECQELYDACRSAGVDYYTIRDAVYGDDPRFNLWWTFVYPDKRGFNSKCIPKDIYAWCAWAESVGYEPKITRGILEKNKEWIQPFNRLQESDLKIDEVIDLDNKKTQYEG